MTGVQSGCGDLAEGPLVSVVVPVYGVERYLPECVDAVLGQSYRNIEVVLVDDGSPDGCGALCDAYAERDARVRVVHQANRGLSAARNAGLDVARGEFVAFVDSDDAASPLFVETLLRGALTEDRDGAAVVPVDIVQCGFCRERSALEGTPGEVRYERLTGLQASERLQFDSTGAWTVVWNKLYRHRLFEDLRFPEGRRHEDEFVTYRALWAAGGVSVTDACLYYYRRRGDSITGSGFDPHSLDAVDALGERAAFYREHGEERLAVLTDATTCHRLYGMMRDIERAMPDRAPELRRRARTLFWRVLRSRDVGVKKKLGLCLKGLRAEPSGSIWKIREGAEHGNHPGDKELF